MGKGFFSLTQVFLFFFSVQMGLAQIGYFDAPYLRYEADTATLFNATITPQSYAQSNLQCEASNQTCINLSATSASVEWTVKSIADGLVLRYSIPDGESGAIDLFINNVYINTINLSSYYAWQYLWLDGNPNNVGIVNQNVRMRFDEVRFKFPSKLAVGNKLKLVRQTGNIHVDFVELENVPAPITASIGDVTYTGNGSDLQNFINANGGKTIYLPEGVYQVNSELYFGADNTKLKGAGEWFSQIHFTNNSSGNGGLRANATNVSFSGLYLTTVCNSRSNSYKAINGVFTSTSVITNVWAEHFEAGAWIAQFNTGSILFADGLVMSHCRFRNNYADGINLAKGTRNSIVEHCNFRNNGDDDMAIWSSNGMECQNNTYRYNTSENSWRSAGCAIYGGINNKAQNLLIRDNLEAGIKVNNSFSGVGFNTLGTHVFENISIYNCGTFNDLFNGQVGAIDLLCNDVAGLQIRNIKFSNISIYNSKNDAIYIRRNNNGEGFFNLIFENISIDGTGKEFPDNNFDNLNWSRGYGILFVGYPQGYGTYCNVTTINRGGNAAVDMNISQKGTFDWSQICYPSYTPEIISGTEFGICDESIQINVNAPNPSGYAVNFVEFFVDNTSIGVDYSAPYSMNWTNGGVGNYELKATSHYTSTLPSSTSLVKSMNIHDGVFDATTSPLLDGLIDNVWMNYTSFPLTIVSQGAVTSASDLSAYYKILRTNTHLYILVDVTDDILRNDGAANWQKDGIELYLDMGNDKTGAYVANNDFQYSFIWNQFVTKPGLAYAHTTKSGNLGYVFEIGIPWTTLQGVPNDGSFLGIDVHVEDNDSGTRNGKLAWHDEQDIAWQNTAALGTLQIASCNNPHLSIEEEIVLQSTVSQFSPNPFSDFGTIFISSDKTKFFNVQVKDLSGKLLESNLVPSNLNYTIGEFLNRGIYILEISDGESLESLKLIKL